MEQRLSGSKLDPLGPTGTSWAAGAASTGRGNRGDRQKSAFPLFDTKEIKYLLLRPKNTVIVLMRAELSPVGFATNF